jgi:DNA topoisomerase IA
MVVLSTNMSNLLIIEAPGKVETIQRLIQQIGFVADVFATGGRLYDLPKNKMGFSLEDLENIALEPLKPSLIEKLKAKIRDHDHVYIMSDDDHEGELIASHVNSLCAGKVVSRLLCDSLTVSGVKSAISAPTQVNTSRAQGALNRRVFDRISGYFLSSWDNQESYLNGTIGRVLSPLLHHFQKEKPVPKSIIEIPVFCKNQAVLIRVENTLGSGINDGSIKAILSGMTGADVRIKDQRLTKPDIAPMTAQEALVFFSERTASSITDVANSLQDLYEQGKISYPRTESKGLSSSAKRTINGIALSIGETPGEMVDAVSEKIKTHDGLHVTGVIQSIGSKYENMALEDKIWTLLYRNNISSIRDLVLTIRDCEISSPAIDLLKAYPSLIITASATSVSDRGMRREYHFDPIAGLCPELSRGWSCSASVERVVASSLRDLGLGRPSTIPYHSEKIANRYLNALGGINYAGYASINKAVEVAPLIMSIDRIHEVDRLLLTGDDINEIVYRSFQEIGITRDYISKKSVGGNRSREQSFSEFNLE